ncbi:MAG: hypothetical protein ACLS9A_06520 [Clostridia bacterium]
MPQLLCCRNSSNTARNILRTENVLLILFQMKESILKRPRLGHPEKRHKKNEGLYFHLVDGKCKRTSRRTVS